MDDTVVKRLEEKYGDLMKSSCDAQMLHSYDNLLSYGFTPKSIVMSPEWYTKCYQEVGQVFFSWNGLKVLIDRDQPASFAFTTATGEDKNGKRR